MSWLDKLLSALKGALKDAIHIHDIININNVHVTNNQQSPSPPLKVENKILYINLNEFPPDIKKKVLQEAVLKDAIPLIEESAEKTLEDFKKAELSSGFADVINPLHEYIPDSDLLALRASLFIRQKFKKGENIHERRLDVIYKFGERGRKITNLCTAEYFESTIIPLLNEMRAGSDFSKEKFLNIYNLIIEESGFAVFVSGGMKQDKVKKKIVDKIRSNIKYGIKFVHIHGIGKENIQKIRKAVGEIMKDGIEKTNEDMVGNAIYVRLALEPDLIDPFPES